MNAVGLVVAVVLAGLLTRGLLALALAPARYKWLRIVKWTFLGIVTFIGVTQVYGLFLFVPVMALFWWQTDVDELDAEFAALLEAEAAR